MFLLVFIGDRKAKSLVKGFYSRVGHADQTIGIRANPEIKVTIFKNRIYIIVGKRRLDRNRVEATIFILEETVTIGPDPDCTAGILKDASNRIVSKRMIPGNNGTNFKSVENL